VLAKVSNNFSSLLASGSDDQTAIIWDAVAHRTKLIHRTGHSGNIFSVKFLPHANDGLLVTAAADGEIRLHDLSRSEVIEEIRCNEKRVKRISTTPAMPYMFWSAAEDGTVRQYDLRETSSDHNRILINLRSACGSQAEVKCLSINPTQPNLLAIGCSDQYVRLFDIRKLVVRSEAQMGHPYPEDAPLHYFCPGHLNEQISHKRMRRYRQFAVTYVTWSLDGRELLVNLGSEQVYLYDLCDIRRPVHFSRDDKCDDLPSETSVVEPMSDRALQLKVEGNTAFKEEKYSKAIYLYSEAMIHSPKQPVLHANRAAAYLKRQWYGDVYAALKDCYTALSFDPSNHKAHLRQANCLLQLKWHNLAKECIQQFQQRFPTRAAKSQELAKAIEEDANKSSRSKGKRFLAFEQSVRTRSLEINTLTYSCAFLKTSSSMF
jgi:WD and tetratricopeptide repeat-containing protein 1